MRKSLKTTALIFIMRALAHVFGRSFWVRTAPDYFVRFVKTTSETHNPWFDNWQETGREPATIGEAWTWRRRWDGERIAPASRLFQQYARVEQAGINYSDVDNFPAGKPRAPGPHDGGDR